jgi:hypothetical protein
MLRSLNAFDGATITADGKTVFVDGHSIPPFRANHIDVVVIAVADADKRLEGVVTNPGSTSWQAELDQSGVDDDKAFSADEEVMLVGRATSDSGEVDLWAGVVESKPNVQVSVTIAHR